MSTLRQAVVAGGDAALELLPTLRKALDGGAPIVPVGAGAAAPAGLGIGEPLTAEEDDADDPTALVIATSGSTGTAKGVLLSRSALWASARATHEHLGGPGHWLLAMPAQHIAGVQVLVRSIVAGTTPQAVDSSDGFRPDHFATAARRTLSADGPRYTALVPTQLRRLLDDDDKGLRALREFDAVLVGGAATPPSLLHRARAGGVSVVTTYGMSETAGGCVYDGVPLRGAEVRIERSTDDGSGPVALRGPMLARGYRNASGPSPFRDGWFHTGDLGRWRDGTLRITGRADDVIITGGVNIAPAPVEQVLTDQPGVAEACVFGVTDAEWGHAVVAAIVPTSADDPPDADALRRAVRAELGAAATPKRVVLRDALPLRGPGKPDRRALRDALDDR